MITTPAINSTAAGITQQARAHCVALNSGVHGKFRGQRCFAGPVSYQLYAAEQAAAPNVTHIGMLVKAAVQRIVEQLAHALDIFQ